MSALRLPAITTSSDDDFLGYLVFLFFCRVRSILLIQFFAVLIGSSAVSAVFSNILSGLAGLVALSIFASGVYNDVIENLQGKLGSFNIRLDGLEYDSLYTPIVFIGWLSR